MGSTQILHLGWGSLGLTPVRLDLELPLPDSESRERPGLTVVTPQRPEQPLGAAVEQVSSGAD